MCMYVYIYKYMSYTYRHNILRVHILRTEYACLFKHINNVFKVSKVYNFLFFDLHKNPWSGYNKNIP